jgi:hypothetical protein
MKRTMTLALCLSASLLASPLYADHEGKKASKTYSTEFKSDKQCSAKHLLGARVNDAQGKRVGEIEDLVIDSGRVQFAVVKLDRDLARGKAFTPVPIMALRPETMTTDRTEQPRVYVFTGDRDKLMTASRFNVERWPADQTLVVWGPDVYSHYGLTWDATGAPGTDVYIQSGRSDLEIKDSTEPPIDYREKSVDNGTAPDGKTTFPFLHEQTDQD